SYEFPLAPRSRRGDRLRNTADDRQITMRRGTLPVDARLIKSAAGQLAIVVSSANSAMTAANPAHLRK
ncbi:MAG TPA: hypothetical protein VN694_06505, partial [Caulobacteraceae bacterium]|nr:hypothetical protein [Caulobacteraceae bacterium]